MASFGADQLSFGTTEPPSSAIVALILSCNSVQSAEGSNSSSAVSAVVEAESDRVILSLSSGKVL